MDDLKPFELNPICSKCGAGTTTVRYCPPEDQRPVDQVCSVEAEHLHRTCTRCGYPWLSKTRDARDSRG